MAIAEPMNDEGLRKLRQLPRLDEEIGSWEPDVYYDPWGGVSDCYGSLGDEDLSTKVIAGFDGQGNKWYR